MSLSFFRGVGLGVIVSVSVLAVVSLRLPLPAPGDVGAPAPVALAPPAEDISASVHVPTADPQHPPRAVLALKPAEANADIAMLSPASRPIEAKVDALKTAPALSGVDAESDAVVTPNAEEPVVLHDKVTMVAAPPDATPVITHSTPPWRPVERYATSFDAPATVPLMGIILVDDGTFNFTTEGGLAALGAFPHPISIAVDPALPDAAYRMRHFRDAGLEVFAHVSLSNEVDVSEVETVLVAALSRMDLTVGILEASAGEMQQPLDRAQEVARVLVATGHGLVTQNHQFNIAPNLALKAGVPADHVFSTLDPHPEDTGVIRRALNLAALRAVQRDSVIVQATLQREIMANILLWTLQDRATPVRLAPVSAVLLRAGAS